MKKFDGVANTLFVPLVARINISKRFPEFFIDSKALELESLLPEDADKGSSEFHDLSSVSRYYNMDLMIASFAERILLQSPCNIVYLGAGLETAYDRLHEKFPLVKWYQQDLPQVIETRERIFGKRANETLISGDMFKMEWVNAINLSLPTLLVVSGVFHYFHEEEVISFIKNCKNLFPKGEMIFDSTSKSGLKYTNYFIKRTGNPDALMYFGIDNCKEFADKCGCELLEERTFFAIVLKILGKKLRLMTKLFMKISEKSKNLHILHLKLN